MGNQISAIDDFVLLSVTVVVLFIISTTVILITLSNFVQILLELLKLKKLCVRFAKESLIQGKSLG